MKKPTNSSRRFRGGGIGLGSQGDSEIPRPSDDDTATRHGAEQAADGSSSAGPHDADNPSEHWYG